MKKVLDFLEKHVQWVAIGLGALFLGLMAWQYIIGAPVTTTVGSAKLGPADIDQYISEHPISMLKSQMERGTKVPLTAPKWVADFKCQMEFCKLKAVEFVQYWANSSTALPKMGEGTIIESITPVEKLPEVAVAIMGGSKVGTSTVNDPTAPQNPVDRTWATVAFQIPNKTQATNFAAVKMPHAAYPIAVFEVTLYRQQQDAVGAWGPETLVRKIPTEQLLPMPLGSAPSDQLAQFNNWAQTHQREIIRPKFYEWVKGDEFASPTMGVAAVVKEPAPTEPGLPNFDPTRWQYTIDEWKQMTPEQSKLAHAALKKHEDEEREKNKPKGNNKGGSKGSGVGHGGARDAQDPDRPDDSPPDTVPNPFDPSSAVAMLAQQPPPNQPQDTHGRDSHSAPPPPVSPSNPSPPPTNAPANPPAAADAAPATQPVEATAYPTGAYDPSTSPDWVGWAIDDTVEPGKVYRYRVVYSIRSPLWDKPQFCADKKLAQVFSIASDKNKTDWSQPVKVASRTTFYIARKILEKSETVPIEVFANVGGVKKSHIFEVAPGDMIGEPEAGVDFVTGSTLVEIGKDARSDRSTIYYAIIADANGTLSRRTFETDATSGDYSADKRAAASGAAASAAPAPAAGGASPPVASGR